MKLYITRPDTVPAHVNVVPLTQGGALNERPVAFILPGGPGASHHLYQPYQSLLAGVNLVFHDPRGCGESDRLPSHHYTMESYIDDVEAIRQHFQLEKIIVIGKSYGAMCALGYALKYPHAVSRLILSAGAPSYHFLETAQENLRVQGSEAQIEIGKKLWSGTFTSNNDLERYFILMNPLYSAKARCVAQPPDLSYKIAQFSYEPLNEAFKKQFWQFDYVSSLTTLKCPTLVLAGKKDWITDAKYSIAMANHIPGSELILFDDASHALETDVGTLYFDAIKKFIA